MLQQNVIKLIFLKILQSGLYGLSLDSFDLSHSLHSFFTISANFSARKIYRNDYIKFVFIYLVLESFYSVYHDKQCDHSTDLYNISGLRVVVSNHLQRVCDTVSRGPFSHDGYHCPLRKKAITVRYLDRRLVCESLFTLGHYSNRWITSILLVAILVDTTHKRTCLETTFKFLSKTQKPHEWVEITVSHS